MTAELIYSLVGIALFVLGLRGMVLHTALLRRLIAANVMGSGVLLVLVALAQRGDGPPDPLPHALVLTGLVVAVSITGLAVALGDRLRRAEADEDRR